MWWQRGVIYQIYPRSFQDASGDGIGDLAGVMQRLDYLVWLGVDAIWFSPIFPSPMKDFGYDVADYTGIHPDYGDLATFDALLEAAHERGLKVLLDLVPNHTSDEHPWFKESRQSRDNPKRDWYIWKDPKPDGSPPNNWQSYFGGPAWTFDTATGQYYMHNFDPSQPELNWRNPDVAAAMFEEIRFWLRRGVDGFRIDVIDRLIKDDQFRDNPLAGDSATTGILASGDTRLYSERRPEVHDVIKQFRRVFDEFPETVAIGELAYELQPEQIATYYGDGDELHLPYNFGLLWKPWDAETIRAYVDYYNATVSTHGWPNYVLGNHDSPRIASKYGLAQARVAAMMLLTLRGTPTLYYGDEIGMTNETIPDDRIQDPQGRNKAGFNRDECRTPMQWDASPKAGFTSNPDVQTWLPVSADYRTVNVEAQQQDPASMLSFYRALLAYRRRRLDLQTGAYESLDAPEGVFMYRRGGVLVVLNFTGESKSIPVQGRCVLSTLMDRDGARLERLDLRGDEGVLIEEG